MTKHTCKIELGVICKGRDTVVVDHVDWSYVMLLAIFSTIANMLSSILLNLFMSQCTVDDIE